MRNIKLTLEYDGSGFFGFQKQPGRATLQEAVEKALSSFFDAKVKIAAASGRTDAGVHALEQVVNFKTASTRELRLIQKGLNALLPESVSVRKIEEAPAEFHARYSVKLKTYEYHVWNDPVRSPLFGLRAFHVPGPLDVGRMRRAAGILKGRHDFRSFCDAGSGALADSSRRGTVRTVKRLEVKRQGGLITLTVEADGFLYHMVRNIAGVLIAAGRGRLALKKIRDILNARDRRAAPQGAPARGLVLARVRY